MSVDVRNSAKIIRFAIPMAIFNMAWDVTPAINLPVDNILWDILRASLRSKLVLLPDFCFSTETFGVTLSFDKSDKSYEEVCYMAGT